jgi:predicted esterase
MTSHQVETVTHGRVLVEEAEDPHGRRLLVACHGYAQNAEIMLDDVLRIPGVKEEWRVASVQGLHRFYARGDQSVVASWMTRQDRELAIADNAAYLDRAVEVAGGRESTIIVFLGFSQGAAMAYRAALRGRHPAAGVIALGGDIPPDVQPEAADRWPAVLLGAGTRDVFYTPEKASADERYLTSAGVPHDIVRFDGGHEWTDAFREAAGGWLRAVTPSRRVPPRA